MSSNNSASEKPPARGMSPQIRLDRLIQEQLEKEIEPILHTAVKLAKEGNVGMLRLLLKHVGVARPGQPVRCELPPVETPEDVVTSLKILAGELATGKLTPAEATHMTRMLDYWLQAYTCVQMEKKLQQIEELAGTGRHPLDFTPHDH